MSIPVLGGPEIKLGIQHCHMYSGQPPPLSRCHLHREGKDAATAAQGYAVWGPALCISASVGGGLVWRVGAGTLQEQPASPRHHVPSLTLSVPSTTARFVPQNCLQPRLPCGNHGRIVCNPKPRLPCGSDGRIILVHSVFCGHQSVPLHLPSTFLSLLIPGSHCCSKNLVKMASPRPHSQCSSYSCLSEIKRCSQPEHTQQLTLPFPKASSAGTLDVDEASGGMECDSCPAPKHC